MPIWRRRNGCGASAYVRRRTAFRRKAKVVDIGFDAGFESECVFHRQFFAHPHDARCLARAVRIVFVLQLPAG